MDDRQATDLALERFHRLVMTTQEVYAKTLKTCEQNKQTLKSAIPSPFYDERRRDAQNQH